MFSRPTRLFAALPVLLPLACGATDDSPWPNQFGTQITSDATESAVYSEDARALYYIRGSGRAMNPAAPAVIAMELGTKQSRVLTTEPRNPRRLARSGDAEGLYLLGDSAGQTALLRLNRGDGAGTEIAAPVWFFVPTRFSDNVAFQTRDSEDLMLYEHATRKARKIGTGAPLSFSPQDDFVLAAGKTAKASAQEFFLLNVLTGETTPLSWKGTLHVGDPVQSPLAWDGDVPKTLDRGALVNMKTGAATPLISAPRQNEAIDPGGAFSPNGRFAFFFTGQCVVPALPTGCANLHARLFRVPTAAAGQGVQVASGNVIADIFPHPDGSKVILSGAPGTFTRDLP